MTGAVPAGAWDCHCHIFGPVGRFPYSSTRTYTPAEATADELMALHANLGFAHAVVVQPQCYGFDHRAMLGAIRRSSGRYRGVALLPEDCSTDDVKRLHDGGVRGARLNFLSHLGSSPDPERLRRTADLIAPFGWHVVLHLGVLDLGALLAHLPSIPTPYVVDHLARIDLRKGQGREDIATILDFLALPGAWLKLSGADRASTGSPYAEVEPFFRKLLQMRPERLIWGTDWPHPNIVGAIPREDDLLHLLQRSVRDENELISVLVDNPRVLYDLAPPPLASVK